MKIEEILNNSGLIESYVLGELSEQEAQGIECLAKTYPEIKMEIEVLQQSLGKYMKVYEKQPPAFLKDRIFSQMTFAEPIENQHEEEVEEEIDFVAPAPTKVIPMWSKLAMAASVLLALTTAWLFTQNKDLKEQQAQILERVESLDTETIEKGALLAQFQNPDNRIIKLTGTEKRPESAVTVLWNQKDNSVSLSVNDLPKPAAGKQYQLWIIGENGPEDMGMLDQNFSGKLLSMKHVSGKPSAFAITLEKEGGVPSPTLEELYVIGNV